MDDVSAPDFPRYPDLRDPRVMVAVPRARRAALHALWALAERLTRLLRETREPLIGQIKLAWWRDMTGILASDPAALPKGEPLLADLQAAWGGQGGLERLVDAAEMRLLAEDERARADAGRAFGTALFGLSADAITGDAGARWGLLWAAMLEQGEAEGRAMIAAAAGAQTPRRSDFAGSRALLMLDRWAAKIAANGGDRRWRDEGVMLFRVGLIGR